MFPKGKLLALLAVFAAIALITASGAFTTVQADRQGDVNVAGDSAALLQIVPSNASSFAVNQSNGEVAINLNSNTGTASGVNPNSTTLEDSTLNITNNGEDTITVNISATTVQEANITFYVDDTNSQLSTTGGPTLGDYIGDINESKPVAPSLGDRYVINSTTNGVVLQSGRSVSVGMYVETHGLSNGTSDSNIFSGNNPITVVAQDETEGNKEAAS